MKDKFEEYLNKIFKKVKKTPELKNITDNEEENYEICINSLGDLYTLIKEYKKDYSKLDKKIELPKYKLGEELLNSISHGIGVLLSITALVLGTIKADSGLALFGVLIYSISSIVLYLMSCIYHSLKPNNAKRIFRIIDHCSIYILIAGTYTPIVLLKLPTALGWWMFGIVWTIAVIGIVLNSIDIKKFKTISMALYLIAGWCIIFSFKSLWENMNHIGILLTLIGGIIYTVGAILYGIGKRKKYMHSVFHIFCVLASVCFFLSIYMYVL